VIEIQGLFNSDSVTLVSSYMYIFFYFIVLEIFQICNICQLSLLFVSYLIRFPGSSTMSYIVDSFLGAKLGMFLKNPCQIKLKVPVVSSSTSENIHSVHTSNKEEIKKMKYLLVTEQDKQKFLPKCPQIFYSTIKNKTDLSITAHLYFNT